MVFPGSSAGKESACNVGDPGPNSGMGRYPGEGIGFPLLCSRASLVAQLVKDPPAMLETFPYNTIVVQWVLVGLRDLSWGMEINKFLIILSKLGYSPRELHETVLSV